MRASVDDRPNYEPADEAEAFWRRSEIVPRPSPNSAELGTLWYRARTGAVVAKSMAQSEESSESTRGKILDTANQLIGNEGADALTMRKVARLVGIRLSSLNHYFPTKSDLIEGCLDAYYERLMPLARECIEELMQGAPIDEAVPRFGLMFFRLAREHQELVRLRIISTIKDEGIPAKRLDDDIVPFYSLAAQALGDDAGQEVDFRVAIRSIDMFLSRYALQSDRDLLKFTGLDDIDEALRLVEKHAGAATLALFKTAFTKGS